MRQYKGSQHAKDTKPPLSIHKRGRPFLLSMHDGILHLFSRGRGRRVVRCFLSVLLLLLCSDLIDSKVYRFFGLFIRHRMLQDGGRALIFHVHVAHHLLEALFFLTRGVVTTRASQDFWRFTCVSTTVFVKNGAGFLLTMGLPRASFLFCMVSDRSRRRSPFCLMAHSIDQRRCCTERFFRCPVKQDQRCDTFCTGRCFPWQRPKKLSGCMVQYCIVSMHFAGGCQAQTPYGSLDRRGRGVFCHMPGRSPAAAC